jgi:hypothetical protein
VTQSQDHKADFSDIYDRPDPGAYYTTLAPLGYRIPELARPVIEAVHDSGHGSGPLLDVCCSYGINAAQLRYGLTFAELAEHYAGRRAVEADRELFAAHSRRPDLQVYGLDASGPAIGYARAAGLLARGWAENLEEDPPSAALVRGIADVTTVVCTGGVGYIGAATYRRILDAHPAPGELRAVTFVLRVFDAGDIAAELARHGLVTEQLPDVTFPQRRFADDGEQAAAVHDVRARGLDPAGKEAAGWFHAVCFVSRPAADVVRTPLRDLVGDLPIS